MRKSRVAPTTARRTGLGGALIGIPLGALGIGVIVVALLAASSPATPGLNAAITADLARQGIIVGAQQSAANVPIKREQAEAVAREQSHDPARTTVATANLATVIVRPNQAFNCLCWVISLRGPGGFIGGPPGTDRKAIADRLKSWTRYYVAFVDARSGKYEFALESYLPPAAKP
jgi:hypothetical protein